MRKASPWNSLPSWSALPEPQKRQARVFALGAGAGIAAAVLGLWLPGGIAGFQDRFQQKRALAPLARQARDLALDYEAVRARPQDHLEKPVLWCVDTVAAGVAYNAGRPSQPVVWENAHRVATNSPTSGGRCTTALAVVVAVKREGVVLRYLGIP